MIITMGEFRGFQPKVKQDRLYVGIDVSKESHVAVIQYPDGAQSKGITFSNRREGFRILCREIGSASRRTGILEVVVAIEPTGHYGMVLSHYLHRKGYRLVIVQGKRIWAAKVNIKIRGNTHLVSCGNQIVYVDTEGTIIVGINKENGNQMWLRDIKMPLELPPAVADSLLLVLDEKGTIHSFLSLEM